MATTAKNAILKALLDGVITELMIKTTGEQVYLTDDTTLSSKISEMVMAINARAKTADVEQQILALKQELLGDIPVEAYNTFTELAEYISEHQEAADALTQAIGNKADASVVDSLSQTINALGSLARKSKVSESDLDDTLKEKVNAAAEGNHSHNNKTLLDTYDQSNDDIKDAITKKHSHTNADVLEGISADNVSAWNAKSKIHVSASQPSNMGASDLWIQTV